MIYDDLKRYLGLTLFVFLFSSKDFKTLNLTDVTWAVEDFNSKLVDVVSFAGVDDNSFSTFSYKFQYLLSKLRISR